MSNIFQAIRSIFSHATAGASHDLEQAASNQDSMVKQNETIRHAQDVLESVVSDKNSSSDSHSIFTHENYIDILESVHEGTREIEVSHAESQDNGDEP